MGLFRRRPTPKAAEPLPAVLEGTGPDGGAVSVDVSRGRWTLYFLTSTCTPCQPVWRALALREQPTGPGLAVVTPGAATESRRKLLALRPAGVPVVMSSDTWFAFSPGPAPWMVVTEEGVVISAGPAQA